MAEPIQRLEIQDDFELPKKSASAKNSEEKNSEQRMVAALGRSRGSARRQFQKTSKDPNEADRQEIEDIETRAELTDGDPDPSLSAKQNANGDIIANLKFEVPLSKASTERLVARRLAQKNNPFPARPYSPIAQRHVPDQASPIIPNEISEEEPTVDDFTLDEPDLLNNDEESFSDSDATAEKNESDLESSEEDTAEENGEEGSEENTFEDEAKEEEEREKEKKSTEQVAYERQSRIQNQALQNEKKEKDEALREQTQKQAQAQSSQQMQAQRQNQQKSNEPYLQAIRKKQNLDRKLTRLKAEKIALQAALYTAKATKVIVDIVQAGTKWLASLCTSAAWTIILGIFALIGWIIYALLFIPKTALWTSIKLIQAKIDSINEDIEKTKKNQQKLTSVIQSIQQKKRTGTSKPSPKFDVPKEPAGVPGDS